MMKKIKYSFKKMILQKQKIFIAKKVVFNEKSFFEGHNVIGEGSNVSNTTIGYGTYIGNNSNIKFSKIGRYCCVGSDVKVIIGKHPIKKFVSMHPCFFSLRKQAGFTYVNQNKFIEIEYLSKEEEFVVEIGSDVWIGQEVNILNGIRIGDGAVIGANSLVTKDIKPYSINVGIPAKCIGFRFNQEDINFIINDPWWNKNTDWIKDNVDKFDDIDKYKKLNFN